MRGLHRGFALGSERSRSDVTRVSRSKGFSGGTTGPTALRRGVPPGKSPSKGLVEDVVNGSGTDGVERAIAVLFLAVRMNRCDVGQLRNSRQKLIHACTVVRQIGLDDVRLQHHLQNRDL